MVKPPPIPPVLRTARNLSSPQVPGLKQTPARSSLLPVIPSNVIAPPLKPDRIKGFQISTPVKKWTVEKLARSLTLEEQKKVGNRLAREFKTECAERPAETNWGGTEGEVPGALLVHNGNRKVVVVGDLHGNVDRLNLILSKYGALLESGEAELVFLGDIIHPELSENLGKNASSIQCLKAVMKLKYLYKDIVNLVLGNHDVISKGPYLLDGLFAYVSSGPKEPFHIYMRENGFNKDYDPSMGITKGTHLQAYEFLLALYHDLKAENKTDEEIKASISEYQRFFDGCPLAMIVQKSKGRAIYMAHSAVIKGGVTKDELIDARKNGLAAQLLYNKWKNSHSIYTAADVQATVKRLKLTDDPADTIAVSGHMPSENGAWGYCPFKGINNHVVIHGNVYDSFGVLEIVDGDILPPVKIDVAGTPAANVA